LSTDEPLPNLPPNKSVIQVFGDFLRYLYECTRKFIGETYASGEQLWTLLEGHAEFVLTHPTDEPLPDLPPNKSVVQVFGDFLHYLYECTRKFIEETHASGEQLWTSVEGHVEFVLTHPNGWEAQRAQMRRGQSTLLFWEQLCVGGDQG
jgi:hypothetical protein